MSPKDYPENKQPTQVVDVVAENGINRGAIIQGMIFIAISSLIGMSAYFGDRVITGLDKVNETLTGVSYEISRLNTGLELHDLRMNNMDKRNNKQDADISKVEDDINDIKYLYSIK